MKVAAPTLERGELAHSYDQDNPLPACVGIVLEFTRYEEESITRAVPAADIQISVDDRDHGIRRRHRAGQIRLRGGAETGRRVNGCWIDNRIRRLRNVLHQGVESADGLEIRQYTDIGHIWP